MKDFLAYQIMEQNGVAAPLCSYVYITVNGEDWGLYLAVEELKDVIDLSEMFGHRGGGWGGWSRSEDKDNTEETRNTFPENHAGAAEENRRLFFDCHIHTGSFSRTLDRVYL